MPADGPTGTYVDDTNYDRHLHLVRVGKDECVFRAMPAGIQSEGVRVAVRDTIGRTIREVPSRMEQVKRLGEDVVVDETGIHREHAHEKDNVTTAVWK